MPAWSRFWRKAEKVLQPALEHVERMQDAKAYSGAERYFHGPGLDGSGVETDDATEEIDLLDSAFNGAG